MENTDPKAATDSDEEDIWSIPWTRPELAGRLAAVKTREERLAVLREFMSEEDAQYFIDLVMRENLEQCRAKYREPRVSALDLGQMLAEASTREEKLAALRQWYQNEEVAQKEIRLIDLEPLVKATPGRARKLALLREHVDEERVHPLLRRLLIEEKSALLQEYLPKDEASEAFTRMGYREGYPNSAADKEAAQLDVLREYLPEAQAREALSRFLGEDKGDLAFIAAEY